MQRDRHMKERLGMLLVGSLLLAAQVATAQVRVDEEGEKLVRDFVEHIETLQGRFEQALVDASGEVAERSTGTLEIERPGKFRWTYAEPYEQQLVADGLNIWSYDVDLAQVTVKPQADALANTPALLLGGDREALSQFRFDGATLAGEPIFIAGFPAIEGEEPRDVPVIRRGSIASGEFLWSERAMLLLDLTGIPGFSGAPVVLESTGEVVGVVFGTGRTPREYGTTWATPLVRGDLTSRPGDR